MTERSNSHNQTVPGHFLYREPSVMISLVSVLIALAILGYGVSEVHRAGQREAFLSLGTDSDNALNVPVLKADKDQWAINGQLVEETDLLFRLSSLATKSDGIILEHNPGVPAETITRALEFANRSGFAQVGLRTSRVDFATTSSAF